jgi:teichuronic acid biosynthesis glycosyltransferase TuaG
VGIVIPAYNAEAFLAQTLQSVLDQTFPGWIAAVGDDASADGTRAIAQQFADRDPRILVVGGDHNRGLVGMRNMLIERTAPTELISLLDHDDLWRPDYLERMLELYDTARGVPGARPGIVTANSRFFDEHGLLEDTVADRFGWRDQIGYTDMLHKNWVFARLVFSREAYDATDGFAEECVGADDYDLWLQMMEAGYEVVATREPLSFYRSHGANLSSRRSAMYTSHLNTYRRVLARGNADRGQRALVRRRMLSYRLRWARARLREATTRS